MKNTVVIFNAGIGALTLGFKNAGYEIFYPNIVGCNQ